MVKFRITYKRKKEPLKFRNLPQCLNEKWTLTVPHINLTSIEDKVEKIQDFLQEHDNNMGWSTTYATHGNSLLTIWNIILSVGLAYVLFKRSPVGLVYASAPTVNALSKNDHITHHTILAIMVIGLIGFIGYVSIRIILKIY